MLTVLKNKKATTSVGNRGEKAAVNYLKRCGYVILETNFANNSGRRLGEIDIIAKEGNEIVFVEVKTRCSSDINFRPEENITKSKLYKINKAATFYLKDKKLMSHTYRFDAIALIAKPEENIAKLRHIKNIFY